MSKSKMYKNGTKSPRTSMYLKCAEKMPPLKHWDRDEGGFDIEKSDVVAWLIKQPEILQWLYNTVAQKKVISYDQGTGLWQGVDYGQ